ncbi:hypothetical protein DOK76_10775 [Vagococcus sp. DIV0080]|uniref:Lipoprotein n=1 Tax=Candidatus Vagococcus giribetii TaxID=2230876 RepID=A0ABS3HW46_9ENTE|nr:hypothetical protein [Vagococcus sp. DIV0080]MBO0477560.1 hypothetical protein [Vagococcus sp. DIV0080]
MTSGNKKVKWLLGIVGGVLFSLGVLVGCLIPPKDNGIIPDTNKETLKIADSSLSDVSLLFNYSGAVDLNTKAKEVTVYLDYYEQGDLKKHDSVIAFSQEEKSLKGRLVWGISQDDELLTIALASNSGSTISNTTEVFWLKDEEGWMSGSSAADNKREIKVGSKYLLYKWVNDKSQSMSAYTDDSEEFNKEKIAKNDKLVQLYIEFK